MPDPAFPRGAHRLAEPRWFEDLQLGERFLNPSRTMTEALFAAFQLASADNHPIHYDREYCHTHGHRDLLAHGLLVTAQAAAGAGMFPHGIGESLIAFLEQSSRFLKPVYLGDTRYPALTITPLEPRRTKRLLVVVTVVLAGVAFALVSVVGALWQLYLLVGLLGGIGMSSFYLLSTTTVSHWFDERRGLALALVLVGFNLGYITGGPVAAWLIITMGWRAAYWVLGGGCALLSFCAAITVRLPRPAERRGLLRAPTGPAGAPPDGLTLRQSLRNPRQWGLNLSWLLLGGLAIMISVHAVPFARDRGVSLADASLALTAYGIGSGGGRLTAGFISDRVGTRPPINPAYVVEIVALLGLSWVPARGG